MWNWYCRAKASFQRPPEEPREVAGGIPEGYSTHDYIGGSPLYKRRTLGKIEERSKRVDGVLKKYR